MNAFYFYGYSEDKISFWKRIVKFKIAIPFRKFFSLIVRGRPEDNEITCLSTSEIELLDP